MEDYEKTMELAELSEDELSSIAGGGPLFDLPPDAPRNANCPQCGYYNYVKSIDWGKHNPETGEYMPNAFLAKFKCKKCGHTWKVLGV